jgi:hypothetical protein
MVKAEQDTFLGYPGSVYPGTIKFVLDFPLFGVDDEDAG